MWRQVKKNLLFQGKRARTIRFSTAVGANQSSNVVEEEKWRATRVVAALVAAATGGAAFSWVVNDLDDEKEATQSNPLSINATSSLSRHHPILYAQVSPAFSFSQCSYHNISSIPSFFPRNVAHCDLLMPPSTSDTPYSGIMGNKETLEWMDRTASKHASLEATYRIDQVLGIGAFGSVSRGTHKTSGKQVAIKRMPKDSTSDTDVFRELHALLSIQKAGGHLHLCGLQEHFDEGSEYALVLDLVRGGELFDAVCNDGIFSEANAARLIRQLADALSFLHALQLVHSDLKPENVLLSTTKVKQANFKVVDFGSCRSAEFQPSLPRRLFGSLTGMVNGSKSDPSQGEDVGVGLTSAYCPPEIVTGIRKGNIEGRMTPAMDMWSLGCILFVLLTGRHPFDLHGSASDDEVMDSIVETLKVAKPPDWGDYLQYLSPEAQEVVFGLLEPDPQKRWTPETLLQNDWVLGKTAELSEVSPLTPTAAVLRKHKTRLLTQLFKSMLQTSDQASNHSEEGTSEQRDLLHAALARLDTNGRGYLTSRELPGLKKRLPFAEAAKLLRESGILQDKYFPAGHVIYRQGDVGDEMYFVQSGRVGFLEERKHDFIKYRGAGEVFGEGVSHQCESSKRSPLPRYGLTAKCLTPVHVIQISRRDYERYVQADPQLARRKEKKGRLRRRRHQARLLVGMAEEIKHVDYGRGETIFSRGKEGDCLYTLTEGQVETSVDGRKVRTMRPGEVTGYRAVFFGNKPYNVTANCVSAKCTMGVLQGKDVRKNLAKNPRLNQTFRELTLRRDFRKTICATLERSFPETEDDLKSAFKALLKLGAKGDEVELDAIAKMVKSFDPSYNDEDIGLMLKSLDLSGRHTLSFADFCTIFGYTASG